jgi:hypothetical protein
MPQEASPSLYDNSSISGATAMFQHYVNFYFNASIDLSFDAWLAAGQPSVAAVEQGLRQVISRLLFGNGVFPDFAGLATLAVALSIASHPDFVSALDAAWAGVALGLDRGENMFAVYRLENSDRLYIRHAPYSPAPQHSYGFPDPRNELIAIVHTHPNIIDGNQARPPEEGDFDSRQARRTGDFYFVMTNRGLYVHIPGWRDPIRLR